MVIGAVMVGCASCLLQKGFESSASSKTQHSESEFEDQLIKEYYLWGCFSQNREVVSVKVIQNKQTGQCEGYGFIELATRAAAERIMQTHHLHVPIPHLCTHGCHSQSPYPSLVMLITSCPFHAHQAAHLITSSYSSNLPLNAPFPSPLLTISLTSTHRNH